MSAPGIGRLSRAWLQAWFRPVPADRLAWFRILTGWLMLYDLHIYNARPFAEMAATTPEATWRPIYLFELFGLGPPDPGTAQIAHVLQIVAVFSGTLGFFTRTSWLCVALLGFWSGGMVYSFTKVRHDRVALFFASFALGLSDSGASRSLDALLRRARGVPSPSTVPIWPLRLTQVTLAIGYAAAGLTKLTTPGWNNGYTLQAIMLAHGGRYAGPAAAHLWLCRAASWLTTAVETSMPLLLVWRRLAWVVLPCAMLFHLGTWATMDTGPYMTLWFFLVAFVDLDRVGPWLGRVGPLRAALGAALAAAWLGLVGYVLWLRVPHAQLLALALATALLATTTRPPAEHAVVARGQG